MHRPSADPPTHRFMTRDGRVNVLRHGLHYHHPRDWYHWMLTLAWPKLIGIVAAAYMSINVLFGMLYFADPGGIANARYANFSDSFFFSVQTLSTVGYGGMLPKSLYVNCVVTLECLIGMLSVGLVTGLLFSRFARPSARVMFSHYAVVGPYEGLPTLVFRTANRRGNQILQAEIRATLLRNEKTLEGESLRRPYDLKLVRHYTPFFNLTWTVRHQIDKDSPLYGQTTESIRESETEILILLSGIDDVFGQPVHSRFAFNHEEILFNHRFVSMFGRDERNRPIVDYRNFDTVEEIPG